MSMGLDLQDSALRQRQMACWAHHYFLAPLQGDTLHMDDLMHPDTPQPAPFYVIKVKNAQYPYLERSIRGATESNRDILKALRFKSQSEALDYIWHNVIGGNVLEIIKVTTAFSTPAPEYTVTKAEPYAEGFFYVVKNEITGGYMTAPGSTELLAVDHARVVRFKDYFKAQAEARDLQSVWGYKPTGFCGVPDIYAVYRVEPKRSAPKIEKVLQVSSL